MITELKLKGYEKGKERNPSAKGNVNLAQISKLTVPFQTVAREPLKEQHLYYLEQSYT